jgi:hypothetical protein
MHTKISTEDQVLSQHGFLKQLELMGVDINRLPDWGNTLQFNWIPPINIDMLVNYADYYWKPAVPGEPPQYMTIEGRCNKATSKVAAYSSVVQQYGATIPVHTINVADNSFVLQGRYSDLFVAGFIFYTKDTTDINLNKKFWHVVSSTYDATTGFTTITPIEDMAIRQDTPPTTSQVGRWWYNTSNGELKKWSGSTWVFASTAIAVNISLTELLAAFQSDADCACGGGYGWDVGQFDDGQTGSTLWNTALLAQISFFTEGEWVTQNGGPAADGDLWYDLSTDELKQYASGTWVVVDDYFSFTLENTRGIFAWDYSANCDVQVMNDWSSSNHWIHKSSVTSSDGIIRAQMPILEYGSTIELNEWTETRRTWKYRSSVDNPFEVSAVPPSRLELECKHLYRHYTG